MAAAAKWSFHRVEMLQHFVLFMIMLTIPASRAFVIPSRRILRKTTPRLVMMSSSSSAADICLNGKMLVTVQEALPLHSDPTVKFVDGSWFLKGRNGREEFEAGPRIKGAVYFDIDDIASKGLEENPRNIKHMMPPPALFAAAMDAMKIANEHHLIVYGTEGCVSVI